MAELRTFSCQDWSTDLALVNNMRAARQSLIAVSCTPDVWRLCSGQIPDVDRIIACLRQNTLQLSMAADQHSGSAAATQQPVPRGRTAQPTRGDLRFPVSAQRYRLQASFGASVSGGKDPVHGGR